MGNTPRARMTRQTLDSLLTKALLTLSALVLFSWVLVAVAHMNDRYHINHASGTWMALARFMAHGTLYPPLVADGAYGGTRWMPLQIVANGGLAKLSGEELVSGKVFAYVVAAVLIALIVVALRQLDCPLPLALALSVVPLVTDSGLLAATAVYGDALPVVLQLAALVLILRRPTPSWAVVAGALCALAVLSKLSAVWAAAAILIWLLLGRERRSAIAFFATTVVAASIGVLVFELISRGRMFENVVDLSTSGFIGVDGVFLHAPLRLGKLVMLHAPAIWVLCGVALVAFCSGLAKRRLTLYQLSLAACFVVLVVILADHGTDWNHLLDLEVATVLVVGEFWVLAGAMSRGPAIRTTVSAIVVLGLITGYAVTLSGDTRGAFPSLAGTATDPAIVKYPLADIVTNRDAVLSEDPTIPVLLDRTPVVLDAFMFLRLEQKFPRRTRGLVRRLDRKAFTKVVLIRKLDVADDWWRTNHFGPRVVRSIDRNYRLAAHIGTYWVYEPR